MLHAKRVGVLGSVVVAGLVMLLGGVASAAPFADPSVPYRGGKYTVDLERIHDTYWEVDREYWERTCHEQEASDSG
ncbi:MAG: hypothetical protein ACRBN8_01875 [Nannocystales bacterium]